MAIMDILEYRAQAAAEAGNKKQQELILEAIELFTLLKHKDLIDDKDLPPELLDRFINKKSIKLKLLGGLDIEILDQRVRVTNLHRKLLSCLLNSPDYAAPREQMARAMYGDNASTEFEDDNRRLVAAIYYFNKKLKDAGILEENLIVAMWGWGYKLNTDLIKT